MNLRTSVAGLFALAFAAGCASGSGGGADSGMTAQQFDEENLPEWVQALPEGTPPRDNEQTNEAEVALFQARSAGDEERAAGFYQEALTQAQAAMAADPGNPQPFYQAGQAYMGMGNLQAAGESFDQAEEIYPRYILDTQFLREETWIDEYNEAVGLLAANPDSALVHLERAHSIYKGRPEAALQLGQIYMDVGQPNDAIEAYRTVIESVDDPRAREGADEEVLSLWDEMREVAQFNGAQLLFQEERYAEAAEIYEDILEANPADLMALTNLGAAFVAAGETERANEVFARLRSRDDLTAREFFMIGIGLTQADQLQEAAEVFAEAHALIPQDREALFMQAQALYFWANDQGGDWATLVPVAQRLNELDTHTRLSYTFHFNALLQTGNGEAAQEVYDRMEALPFEVGGLQLAGVQGGAAVAGIVTNRNAAPGSQARIRVHFYDGSGTSVGTQDATVNLGAAGEGVQFQVDLSTSADVMGYRYEVLN